MYELIHGDCLEKMKALPEGSVDLILTDPPYGLTSCKWDKIIPFVPLWTNIWRVLKPRSACLLFGSEPFSTYLRSSQISYFKYDWIWNKKSTSGFVNAKLKPLNSYEIISVFSKGNTANGSINNMVYFPQGLVKFNKIVDTFRSKNIGRENVPARKSHKKDHFQEWTNYPKQLIEFAKENKKIHPTQKPVSLLEYLIKTYTTEQGIVLDFAMGSGSTGVACLNTNRNFIGIEKDDKYFEIAKNRISNVVSPF